MQQDETGLRWSAASLESENCRRTGIAHSELSELPAVYLHVSQFINCLILHQEAASFAWGKIARTDLAGYPDPARPNCEEVPWNIQRCDMMIWAGLV